MYSPGLSEGAVGDIGGAIGLVTNVLLLPLLVVGAGVFEAARSLLPSRASAEELKVPAFVQMSSTLRTFSCKTTESG
jgi:hypothetical protein